MRISDWSSDVCSSDLLTKDAAISGRPHGIHINAIMPTAHTALLDNHPDKDFRRWIEINFPAGLVAATSAFLTSRECSVTGEIFSTGGGLEIGRASCRERVCQYV